jgi:undecaprenyl pyrophosphate synthase
MALHSWPLQQAIYSTLNSASITGEGSVSVAVYDDVPEGSSYPYITIGEETSNNISVKGRDAHEHTLTMHVWSQYRGRKEIKTIMQQIYSNLHDNDISVSGASLVNLKQEFETTLTESDGITRHGVIRFRAVVFDS